MGCGRGAGRNGGPTPWNTAAGPDFRPRGRGRPCLLLAASQASLVLWVALLIRELG